MTALYRGTVSATARRRPRVGSRRVYGAGVDVTARAGRDDSFGIVRHRLVEDVAAVIVVAAALLLLLGPPVMGGASPRSCASLTCAAPTATDHDDVPDYGLCGYIHACDGITAGHAHHLHAVVPSSSAPARIDDINRRPVVAVAWLSTLTIGGSTALLATRGDIARPRRVTWHLVNREQDTMELLIIVGVAAFAIATGTLVSLGRRRGRAAGRRVEEPASCLGPRPVPEGRGPPVRRRVADVIRRAVSPVSASRSTLGQRGGKQEAGAAWRAPGRAA